ncbi:hypothetical protein LCM4579_13845 [Ensifer sp. LCM 4579]|nr:hypothetical protein LCM4579_13845 [Ensifer sp. LCM 4579]
MSCDFTFYGLAAAVTHGFSRRPDMLLMENLLRAKAAKCGSCTSVCSDLTAKFWELGKKASTSPVPPEIWETRRDANRAHEEGGGTG